MVKTAKGAILAVFLSTIINSFAQILYKLGTDRAFYYIIIGLLLYGISSIILILSLKFGELSILYPIIALGYVWVSILSLIILGETMNLLKWSGIVSIIAGVSFIGAGSGGK